jgi:5-methylcytosine-specific restriction enzyme B
MSNTAQTLSEDFKDLFGTRELADALLELFAHAAARLGIKEPDDPMIALTWLKKGGRRRLRLNYGNVVALGIEGKGGRLTNVFLIANKSKWTSHPQLIMEDGEMRGTTAGYAFAEASRENAESVVRDLPEIIEEHFPKLIDLFAEWKGSPYRRYHNRLMMEAILDSEKRDLLLTGGFSALGGTSEDSSIGARAFELLALLEEHPLAETYALHKDEFVRELEEPFKSVFIRATEELPKAITDAMEVSRNVNSRIPKNDYGRGGAHSHYWGAMYPRGGKRISDAQLFLWINAERFRVGFAIGHFASRSHERHVQNAIRYSRQLTRMFENGLENVGWFFGDDDAAPGDAGWQAYFDDPGKFETTVAVELDRDTFLQRSDGELIAMIRDIWIQLFPLVLLTTSEDPIDQIKDYLLSLRGENPGNLIEDYDRYTADDFAEETGISHETIELWHMAIERKRQVVLYGPPGTGKTFIAERLARLLVSEKPGMIGTVQFHPAYTYEEFMEGIRPERDANGGLDYPTKNGRFVDFCIEAEQHAADAPCVFIIDEVNRANLARVLGELMYLLEYRNKSIALPSGQLFRIPENVVVIGTMNTADRSIALVDHALRRRFAFLRLDPNFEVLREYHLRNRTDVSGLIGILEEVNRLIDDPNYSVGISFFFHDNLERHLKLIWETEILPYLEEYFFDRREVLTRFHWTAVASRILPVEQ